MADDEVEQVRRHVERQTGRHREAFTSDDRAHMGRHLAPAKGRAPRTPRGDILLPAEDAKKPITPPRSLSRGRR